jgi:hypothetical protein
MNLVTPEFERTTLKKRRRFRYFTAICAVVLALPIFFAVAAHAQGGPPFRTDDPETPGNMQWEINFGWIGDRNSSDGAYQVPDFDINYGLGDRIQLKYEIPIAIQETRPQAATPDQPASLGQTIGGLGNSMLGIKWRFYEHHPGDPAFHNRFGTGLLGAFGHSKAVQSQPAEGPGESSGAAESHEEIMDLSISTYPQLTLNNPTRSVSRGLVDPGPSFYLPLEINGSIGPIRIDGEVGYNFGNHSMAQSWGRGLLVGHEFSESTEAYIELYNEQDTNRLPASEGASKEPKQRESTLGLGGRQSLNKSHTMNLLLMGGRSFQTISADNSQPSWIAYVGLQILLGPKKH